MMKKSCKIAVSPDFTRGGGRLFLVFLRNKVYKDYFAA